MDIKKLYQNFSGYMDNCKGKKCSVSCCKVASKKGIDIYPDEVIYYVNKYGKDFPGRIIYTKKSVTSFQMFDCLGNDCLLKENKAIICRGFPIKPFSLVKGINRILTSESCPGHKELNKKFVQESYELWGEVYKDRFRTSFWKVWKARYLLRKLK